MCAEGERRAFPPLPCMFSGICPCSPFDRASPRASVSTLGSMTRRLRAGEGAPCPSATPAPEHGSTDLAGARGARRPLPLPPPPLPSLCSTPALALLQQEHREDPAAEKSRPVPAAWGSRGAIVGLQATGAERRGGGGRAEGAGDEGGSPRARSSSARGSARRQPGAPIHAERHSAQERSAAAGAAGQGSHPRPLLPSSLLLLLPLYPPPQVWKCRVGTSSPGPAGRRSWCPGTAGRGGLRRRGVGGRHRPCSQ